MKLSALLNRTLDQDIDVTSLAFDSRFVSKGTSFFCTTGAIDYCRDALAKGASAIIASQNVLKALPKSGALYIESADARYDLAVAASSFYPSHFVFKGAVTGTNGKTSTAWYVRQMLDHLGHQALSVGTLGYVDHEGIHKMKEGLTTPGALAFHQTLLAYERRGYDHVVCEASSHGLDQQRLSGLTFDVAAFTNLTQDHLDYHEDMEAYFKAKAKLFEERLGPSGIAIINGDDAYGLRLAQSMSQKVWLYGHHQNADFCIESLEAKAHGFDAIFKILGKKYEAHIPLLGDFQVMNVLASMAMILAKYPSVLDKLIAFLPSLKSVPGRMEQIGAGPYYVDYAHTPDALENVLKSARKHTGHGKIHLVFGCGGNRDPYKRPLMGAIAEKFADFVYVTDDNPRFEDAVLIRQAIMQGCPKALNIEGREKAIETAFARMKKNDILVVAGKGHETGQTIGDTVIPFRDADVIFKVLKA